MRNWKLQVRIIMRSKPYTSLYYNLLHTSTIVCLFALLFQWFLLFGSRMRFDQSHLGRRCSFWQVACAGEWRCGGGETSSDWLFVRMAPPSRDFRSKTTSGQSRNPGRAIYSTDLLHVGVPFFCRLFGREALLTPMPHCFSRRIKTYLVMPGAGFDLWDPAGGVPLTPLDAANAPSSLWAGHCGAVFERSESIRIIKLNKNTTTAFWRMPCVLKCVCVCVCNDIAGLYITYCTLYKIIHGAAF